MTDDERQDKIDDVRNQLGILLRKLPDMDEGPYEADTTEETDTTEQAAATTTKGQINIDSDDNNGKYDKDEDDVNADTKDDGDVEDDNTLHPRTARKQGCEECEEDSLFSEDSEDDHDDNYHDDHYSESSDDESKKKKKLITTPKSTIQTPKKTHWSGNALPAAQEAAIFLVAIGATRNVTRFMVADGLDEETIILT